jgi:hypothetical protein
VVPLALLALAALGLVGAESVYTHHVAPTLRHDLSRDKFAIAYRTAQGGVSASVRAMTRALNGVYGARETRSSAGA